MQIVIDIPEEEWEFTKESDGCRWSRAIIEGVINGTPLKDTNPEALVYINHILDGIIDTDTIIEADKAESEEEG